MNKVQSAVNGIVPDPHLPGLLGDHLDTGAACMCASCEEGAPWAWLIIAPSSEFGTLKFQKVIFYRADRWKARVQGSDPRRRLEFEEEVFTYLFTVRIYLEGGWSLKKTKIVSGGGAPPEKGLLDDEFLVRLSQNVSEKLD